MCEGTRSREAPPGRACEGPAGGDSCRDKAILSQSSWGSLGRQKLCAKDVSGLWVCRLLPLALSPRTLRHPFLPPHVLGHSSLTSLKTQKSRGPRCWSRGQLRCPPIYRSWSQSPGLLLAPGPSPRLVLRLVLRSSPSCSPPRPSPGSLLRLPLVPLVLHVLLVSFCCPAQTPNLASIDLERFPFAPTSLASLRAAP